MDGYNFSSKRGRSKGGDTLQKTKKEDGTGVCASVCKVWQRTVGTEQAKRSAKKLKLG
jgi:hypothetical protein